MVWQAVEDELDLQLVGDLSGLARMCWVVERSGWLSVCLGGGRVVGGAAGYVGRLVGLGDLGDLGLVPLILQIGKCCDMIAVGDQ